MGDVLRRLVSRTLARQMAQHFQDACSPFQYALSTRAGTECLARLVRAATEADNEATVLSVDGVGAFDHVSRASVFSRLASHERLAPFLACVRQFYGQASQYLWYDDNGTAHVVQQGEGGEQGDPLMPGLFALAQHPALQATQAMLLPGEVLFVFLDDIYILSRPGRARAIFDILQARLQAHAGIQVNLGKTRAWNAGGVLPPGVDAFGTAEDPSWVHLVSIAWLHVCLHTHNQRLVS